MKRFAEQFKKRAEKVRLSAYERDDLRERLLAYMEYHPLPEGRRNLATGKGQTKKATVPMWQNGWLLGRLMSGVAVLFLVIVPALAEKALPGDVLYPVKVRFNEELRGAMNSSPYQQVEWETARLERRLAEAQLLAENGRLTPAAEAEVAEAIKEHSQAALASIESIKESDTEDAALARMSLSSALEVSAEVWTNMDMESGASSTLSGAVSAARDTVSPSDVQVSYAKLLSRIEAETTRSYEYLQSLNQVSEAEKSDIRRRLTDVQVKVDTAAKLKEEDEAAAAKILVEALDSTRKMISFITNLDVRRNVSIEKLVPITPTEAEKGAVVEAKLKDADSIVTEVEAALSRLSSTSNDYVAISATVEQYQSLVLAAEAALNEGNLDEAEVSAAAALELAEALKGTMVGLELMVEEAATSTSSN